ncbi:MAG: hypothetical protein AB1410_08975 [Acidobacteriota bacterium]
MDKKGLYMVTGFCAILAGILSVVGYICYLIGVQSIKMPMPQNVDDVIKVFKAPFVQAAANINALSLIFLFPGIVGIMLFLYQKAKGLSVVGFTFGVLGFLLFFLEMFIESGIGRIAWGQEQMIAPEAVKTSVGIFYLLDEFIMFPGLFLTAVFYLLFGFAFKRFDGISKTIGNLFLLTVLFFILTFIFFAVKSNLIASICILIQVILVAIALVMAGSMLRKFEPTD